MGLELVKDSVRDGSGRTYTFTERLYQTREGKVVKPNDPKRHRLLGVAGQRIPRSEAVKLGLVKDEKLAEKPEDKQRKSQPSNKGRGRQAKKPAAQRS